MKERGIQKTFVFLILCVVSSSLCSQNICDILFLVLLSNWDNHFPAESHEESNSNLFAMHPL